MPPKRRIDPKDGRAALDAWSRDPSSCSRPQLATAVRYLLEELSLLHPGNSVEFRVPPFGVTQFVEGPRHTRGTPPNVVETDPQTFLEICSGTLSWHEARDSARLIASGTRTSLGEFFPLFRSR